MYDYVVKEELLGYAVVTRELLMLSKELGCQIVAGVNVVSKFGTKKSIILCDKDKIHIFSVSVGAQVVVGNKLFCIGDESTKLKFGNKIVMSNKRIYPNLNNCSDKKSYLFLDKFGVSFVENKNETRKFNKYSKFILN